ncbi:MAG: hypothetical protein KA419_08425, partial [Acidobacteria bacterium]|nr:hypothetical protein [Acidobacteriota bacterium]
MMIIIQSLLLLAFFCFPGPGAHGQGGSPPSVAAPASGPGESSFILRARVVEVLTGSRYALDLAGRRSLAELDAAAAPRLDQDFGPEAAS